MNEVKKCISYSILFCLLVYGAVYSYQLCVNGYNGEWIECSMFCCLAAIIMAVLIFYQFAKLIRYFWYAGKTTYMMSWVYNRKEWQTFIKAEFRVRIEECIRKYKKLVRTIPFLTGLLLITGLISGSFKNMLVDDQEKWFFTGVLFVYPFVLLLGFILLYINNILFFVSNFFSMKPAFKCFEKGIILNGYLYEWYNGEILRFNKKLIYEKGVDKNHIAFIKYTMPGMGKLNKVCIRFPVPQEKLEEMRTYVANIVNKRNKDKVVHEIRQEEISPHQQLSRLKSLGINCTSKAQLQEIESWNDEAAQTINEPIRKAYIPILNWIGDNEPYSDQVYSFESKAYHKKTMYTEFMARISLLAKDDFIITHMEEAIDKNRGEHAIGFKYNGHQYVFYGKEKKEWVDCSIIDFMNRVLTQEGNPKRLLCMANDSEGFIVMYNTIEWAREFARQTSMPLSTSYKLDNLILAE